MVCFANHSRCQMWNEGQQWGAWEPRTQRAVGVPGGLKEARWPQGGCRPRGTWGRMEDARRCSCDGAGEGEAHPFPGCPGRSRPHAAGQEGAVGGTALRGTRSTLPRGEPLNAFKKLCNLRLGTARIKRAPITTKTFIPLSVSSRNNRAFDCSLEIALHSSAAGLSKSLLHQLKFLQQGGELNYVQLQNQMPSP